MPSKRQLVDEFVGNKINKVRWLPMDEKSNVVYFVAGGWDEENETENPLTLWSFELPISSRYDGRDDEEETEEEEEEDDRMRLRWSLNHFGSVQDLTVCGNHIFTASSNGDMNFFSFDQKEHKIKEVKKRTQQPLHKGSCNVVVVSVGEDSGEPKRIVTGGEDGVWNHLQVTESDFIKLQQYKDVTSINAIATISDDLIATASTNAQIRMWDLKARPAHQRITLQDPTKRGISFHSASVDKVNKDWIVAGASDGSILIWDRRRFDIPLIRRLNDHSANVWEVQALSSQTILSCSSDCRLLRWDLEEQQQRTIEVTKCYLDINSFDYHQEIDAIVLAGDNELLRLVY